MRMVIGMTNSTKLTLTFIMPKTESNRANVCPAVKRDIKSNNLFQSLKA